MGTVTPVVIPGEGYVRVEVDWRDLPHATRCWIYRRVAGVTTILREGMAARLSGGLAVVFDHEAPLDVPVTYRSVVALNANGDMEDGVAEWLDTTNNGTVGTVTQSRDYYVTGEGLASLKLVPSGAATSKATSEFVPVNAGQSYTITGRIMLPTFWSGGVGVQIQWYNGVTPLTTVGAANDFTPAPGEWGTYGFSAVAPATTTQAKLTAAITGTPPATLPMYVDEVYLTTSGTSINAAADVVVPSNGGGWWTDPLHPATKARLAIDLRTNQCLPSSSIVLIGLGDEEFPADSTVMEVNDAVEPVGTWSKRKSGRSAIRVGTLTDADLAQLKALFSSGAPLFLQLPPSYNEADSYGLYGDLTVGRLAIDHAKPWRIAGSSFTKQAPPIGPPEGTWRTRYMDFTLLATFADFEAAAGGGYDRYTRSVANGWGTSTSGLVTTTVGGAASVYSVNGSQGVIAVDALSANRMVLYPVSLFQFNIRARSIGFTPTGGNPEQYLYARYVDASNYVRAAIYRQSTGGMTARVSQVVGGVETASGFLAVTGAANNSTIKIDFLGMGTNLYLTVWVDGTPKPQAYTVTLGSLTMLSPGQVGVAINLPVTVSNALPLTTIYDDLEITAMSTAPTWLDGLQGELFA